MEVSAQCDAVRQMADSRWQMDGGCVGIFTIFTPRLLP